MGMDLNKTIFQMINGYRLPSFLDTVFIYLHGMKSVEIAFFLFCLILFLIVIGAPKRGLRAASAVFIATMLTYFGSNMLRGYFHRPYPSLDESLGVILRAEILYSSSAFPVVSVMMFSCIAMSIIYYFPRYTAGLLGGAIAYAAMPIYLGVSYPMEAFGSLLVGYVAGYVLMQLLSNIRYFSRY